MGGDRRIKIKSCCCISASRIIPYLIHFRLCHSNTHNSVAHEVRRRLVAFTGNYGDNDEEEDDDDRASNKAAGAAGGGKAAIAPPPPPVPAGPAAGVEGHYAPIGACAVCVHVYIQAAGWPVVARFL